MTINPDKNISEEIINLIEWISNGENNEYEKGILTGSHIKPLCARYAAGVRPHTTTGAVSTAPRLAISAMAGARGSRRFEEV